MNQTSARITMQEETDPNTWAEARIREEQFERNWAWLEANAVEAYSHRGKFICIAGQQLFVGETVQEVLAQAQSAHPKDGGRFTRYIPKEKGARIYAH